MLHLQFVILEGFLILVIVGAALWHWRISHTILRNRATEIDDLAFSRIAVTHADDGLLVMDMRGIIQWMNPAYARIMGRDASEMMGRNPLSFALLPEDTPDAATLAAFRLDPQEATHEGLQLFRNQRKDGEVFWNQINVSFHKTPSGTQYAVLVCRDVTASIEKEKQLEATSRELAYNAAHDALTGAANRTTLTDFMTQALTDAQQNGTRVGVLHIDLDKFKQINDSHGHPAGDAVLVAVVKRISRHIRDSDLLARVGGDEFVVVCQGLQSLSDLQSIGNALMNAVNGPVAWQQNTLNCQISIGAALSDDTTQDVDALLSQSDFALYEVKRGGRGQVATYNRQLHARYTKDTKIAADLQCAIKDNALSFQFQPIVEIDSGQVCSIETLARWYHPQNGAIAPADFLPVAQSLGLLAQIDFLAIDAALDMKRQLNDAGYRDTPVSFNASPDALGHAGFVTHLVDGLRRHDLRSRDVVAEVLETVVFDIARGNTDVINTIATLEKHGIRTVLDDFGGGHSSLIHLANLPIKGVKIDGQLTRTMFDDPMIERVFATLITLCRELDHDVTIEGVETTAQAERLAELGSTTLQGRWITTPLSGPALINWLNAGTDCPRLMPPLSKGQMIA